ncbi:MAG: branched-chain amino acid aminotransferase [Erysipelotrichales bacterium]|nr:branched-chain amino acid aminotransferase [Erysipelotrichales bacterium]
MDIKVIRSQNLKTKPDVNTLGFGKYFTDHMFLMDYTEGIGWHDARIVPYGPLELDPATMVLHYAQETFEGMKAYRRKDGKIQLFRPAMNARRMQQSNERLCIPALPVEDFVEAVKAIVRVDSEWVPSKEGTSLYIRPFMYATEAAVGVHAAKSYQFVIICCSVGAYYLNGITPVKIYVESEYVRAVKGGTGFAKCGGNYASSIIAQKKAQELGYTQVLWLDAIEHKYVEEVGTMNAMFVVDGKIYTSPINGSVLPGITRDSCLHILRSWGYEVHEEALSIDELMEAGRNGTLQECFGTGTAAVISPIGELFYNGETIVINNGELGTLTKRLYDELTGIQWGNCKDTYNWCVEID